MDKGVNMKSTDITIIAAPFGFGPTGKSIAIARELIRRGYSVKILGDENSVKLARDANILAYQYQYRTELNLADLRSKVVLSYLDISTKIINKSGIPLIFADSLFWLRGWFEREYDYPAVLTLSQKFFRSPLKKEIAKTKEFHEVGAILSPGFIVDSLPSKRQQLVFYPGGLRSPYLGDDYGKAYYYWCLNVIKTAAEKADWQLSELIFILPPQLNQPEILDELQNYGIRYLVNCSDTSKIFLESSHAFISPGIETTLESLAAGINPLFTPAFNGSHIPQLIADRDANIGIELSQTFDHGLTKFESGTDNLSKLSQEVEKYTMQMLDDPKVFQEAVSTATKYLRSNPASQDRYPLGGNGAAEIADYLEPYLSTSTVKNAYYRVSVKAKIKQDGKLILVKEDNKNWDLPGGGVEHNETIMEALERELKEEIGVDNFKVTAEPKLFKMIDASANRPLLFIVYEVEINSDSALMPSPNTEIGYFTKNDKPNVVDYSQEYKSYITK